MVKSDRVDSKKEMELSDSFLSRFISGVISVGLGNFSIMVTGLLGVMVVTRYLPVNVFGTFVLIQVIAAFLTRFSCFGLDIAVTKFISSTDDEKLKRQIINTSLFFQLFKFPLVSILAILVRPLLAKLFDAFLFNSLFVFVIILFFVGSLRQLLKSHLQGLFLFKKIAKTDIIASFTGFILIVLFVRFLDQGIIGLLYANIISMSVGIGLAYLYIPVKKNFEINLAILIKMLVFGFPLQINSILTFFFLRIDTLMIGVFLGPTQVAYYEIARKIPESLTGLYEAFRSVFFPFVSKLFAHGMREKAISIINNSNRLISFTSILGALFALLFGEQIILLLFSEKYLANITVFILLMVGLNFAFIDYTLGNSLVAVGDSDKPAYINVVHVMVSLLCNLLLIPLLGLVGAALSSLAGFAVVNPLNLFFLQRRRIRVRIGDYIKPILIFGACWLLYLFISPTSFFPKLTIIALFILICALLSIISPKDITAVLRVVLNSSFKLIRKSQLEDA